MVHGTLDDSHFEESKVVCKSMDHAHRAPACRTLTKSGRSDEHGSVKVLRSEKYLEGDVMILDWLLCVFCFKNPCSIENSWGSFLWQLRCVVKVMQIKTCELVLLHPCAYGAASQKASGILTTAGWMKSVCSLCVEVRSHRHVPLVGKAWNYLDECEIWRKFGLCVAWSKSLMQWR